MKRISKLLVCSLIMIFGILFYTDVLAGEESKTGEFSYKCSGKDENGASKSLAGCTYSLYKIVNNERVFVENFTSRATTEDVHVEVIKGKTNQFVLVENSAPTGYVLEDASNERTITFEWSDEGNIIYYTSDAIFNHKMISATISIKDKPADQGGVELSGHNLHIRDAGQTMLQTCRITDVDANTKLIVYDVNGDDCYWQSGKITYMKGFPTATYWIYDETNTGSANPVSFSYSDGAVAQLYYASAGSGDYGVHKSTIYLIVALSSLLIGLAILLYIYSKKQKLNN